MPSSMRAAILEEPDAAFRVTRFPLPVALPGQVLVRIGASGLNPLDLKIRAGKAGHARQALPAILGIDMAGVVEAVGDDVVAFRPGDEVYGMTGGAGGVQGSLAEYAAVDARLLAIKPTNFSMREAAALPLVFITAWEGLVDRAGVRAGQTVLVHGGAGGVGQVAIQIAASLGAVVHATGTAAQRAVIERLGATHIDYEQVDVSEYLETFTASRGFDVIYDTVGGRTLDDSFMAVARFGHVVSCLGWGTHALAPLSFNAASYSGVFTLLPLLSDRGRTHHGEIMMQATALAEAGLLIPNVDSRRFDLSSVNEAYALLEQRQATGKVVVDIASHSNAFTAR